MAASYDVAMSHAGRDSTNTFRDLRSASRARNRTLRHRLKYNKFKRPGLTPSDLPSSPNQQSHYIPNPRGSIESKAPWEIFPADLSTAPVVKFTKREAYDLAQEWPRPPTYHHSRYEKNFNKWQRQRGEKKEIKRCINEGEPVEDANWFEFEEDLIRWLTPFDRYCYFREDRELWEGTEDDVSDPADEGYHSDEEAREEAPTWYWHRNFIGQWFRADWPCMYTYCACFSCWNLPVEWEWDDPRSSQPFSLAECLCWEEEEKEPAGSCNRWDALWEGYDYVLADFMRPPAKDFSDFESEREWDLVSSVESEAWSEILDDFSETDQT